MKKKFRPHTDRKKDPMSCMPPSPPPPPDRPEEPNNIVPGSDPPPPQHPFSSQYQFQQPVHSPSYRRYPGSDAGVVLEEMEQIWIGVDEQRRQMTIYLTSEVTNQIGVAPGLFLDEKQVVQFIGMCQQFLRELRKLPLPPKTYP